MSNELQMIQLLIARVEANGDSLRKRIFGYHGQISELCATLLTRLHAGDPGAVTDIAKIRLLNDAIQSKREKSDQSRKFARAFQDGCGSLYGPCTDGYEHSIEIELTKLELEKSIAN